MTFDSKGILQSEYSDLNGSLQVTLINLFVIACNHNN